MRRTRNMQYASSLDKAQHRRPKKSIAQRLLQAAVTTVVESSDSFMQDMVDASTTRQPLHFQIVAKASVDGKSSNRRQWCLVDPKKTTPFPRGPKLKQLDADGPVRVKPRQPLTQWHTIHRHSPIKEPLARKSHVNFLPCPPLSFVPLHAAEESYSRNKGKPRSKPTRLLPDRESLTFVEEPLPSQKLLSVRPASNMPCPNKTQQIDPEAPLPQISRFDDLQTDIRDPCSSYTTSSPRSMSDDASTSKTLPALPIAIDSSAPPMRPLASFLGSFLETVRTATQTQGSQKFSRPSTSARGTRLCPRPRTTALTQQRLTFDSAPPDDSLAYVNYDSFDVFSDEPDLEKGDVDFMDNAPVTMNLADVLK
ncbi:uncharacterized protein BT62DRAFT_407422 [Guyanagaster necrorhizus]|uniref:Uncharacterized protein n=1 Tax=Guyanagaster necrorhizus TaxID=856835 RepID=A0A9P7W2Z0_9AGAR|nr:uncharacterized protein BT62DRAFT_407422 [Guyanagaster necrorhizus MCA 3950]KAG7451212.1 hypothetical protein BT62DRAFT_407422 [Guyanagaster necrorhizus MCA 3950]